MSIRIGNNNRIRNTNIAEKIEKGAEDNQKSFFERHPVVCGFFISLIAGIVLMFSFWGSIIEYLEGMF